MITYGTKSTGFPLGDTGFIQSGKSWEKVHFLNQGLEGPSKSWSKILGSLKIMESHGIFSFHNPCFWPPK